MITQLTTIISLLIAATATIPVSEGQFVASPERVVSPISADISSVRATNNVTKEAKGEIEIPIVPFYSQFNDISSPNWKKVSCGIAGLAMIVELYKPGSTTPDQLLKEGINSGAYISSAGWSHAGLIKLSNKYGLGGYGEYPTNLSMTDAFSKLKKALEEGPVIASVHYKFDPRSTIPHLVVVNGVKGNTVYYNDPAEQSGGGEISIEKFQSAWKKRFIVIRPQ